MRLRTARDRKVSQMRESHDCAVLARQLSKSFDSRDVCRVPSAWLGLIKPLIERESMNHSFLRIVILTVVGSQLSLFTTLAYSQSGSRSGAPQQPAVRSSLPATVRPAQQQSFAPRQSFAPLRRQTPSIQRPTAANRPATQLHRPGFDQIDHQAWDRLLSKYVDGRGNVAYPSLLANEADRRNLVTYLRHLGSVDTSRNASTAGEMAFWINAYNAWTIEGILQVFPTTSIKNHAPDAKGFNIWDDFKMTVDGGGYSLNDMEHKILRTMGDPRIHFAIVCASRGCPQLSQRAYFPQSLDQQLSNNARLFFRSPDKFRYDVRTRSLELSPIIDWFGEDFGSTQTERLRYLAQFMPADAANLATSGSANVTSLGYDWSLNLPPQTLQRPTSNAVRPANNAFRPASNTFRPTSNTLLTERSDFVRQDCQQMSTPWTAINPR